MGHCHDNLQTRTNQRTVFKSYDQSKPIRGQYSGHVISQNKSEATDSKLLIPVSLFVSGCMVAGVVIESAKHKHQLTFTQDSLYSVFLIYGVFSV